MAEAGEEQAGHAPAKGEWSAKETIAHLCVSMRDLQFWMGNLIIGDEPPITPGNPSVIPEKLTAVTNAAPTVKALLSRLAQDQADTLSIVAALRPEIVANKFRYRRIAQEVFESAEHISEHNEQLTAALAVAK